MKKLITLLSLVLFCYCSLCVEASGGSLEITLQEEGEFTFTCVKVAEMINGEYILAEPFQNCEVDFNEIKHSIQTMEAIEKLKRVSNVKKIKMTTEDGVAKLHGLEAGVYLVEGLERAGYQISESLVTIPAWDKGVGDMSMNITIVPKIEKENMEVQTGDSNTMIPLISLCVLSMCVVFGLSMSAYLKK